MANRLLIVARMDPAHAPEVASLFAASDQGALPEQLGVTQRDLFAYQGLYFHHVTFENDARQAMDQARDRADFQDLSARLSSYISPYDPATWRSPADAMAQRFYHWSRSEHGIRDGK
jgi:hypothetical protein